MTACSSTGTGSLVSEPLIEGVQSTESDEVAIKVGCVSQLSSL